MVQPLGKIVWQFLIKLNIHLAYDSAIPLLVQEKENLIFIQTSAHECLWLVTRNHQHLETAQCPSTGEWINIW